MRISDWSSDVCSSDLRYVWVVLGVLLSFGAIGFYDDYRKLVLKDSRGLASRWKYFWQSVFGLGAALFLFYTAPHAVHGTTVAETAMYVQIGRASCRRRVCKVVLIAVVARYLKK